MRIFEVRSFVQIYVNKKQFIREHVVQGVQPTESYFKLFPMLSVCF